MFPTQEERRSLATERGLPFFAEGMLGPFPQVVLKARRLGWEAFLQPPSHQKKTGTIYLGVAKWVDPPLIPDRNQVEKLGLPSQEKLCTPPSAATLHTPSSAKLRIFPSPALGSPHSLLCSAQVQTLKLLSGGGSGSSLRPALSSGGLGPQAIC